MYAELAERFCFFGSARTGDVREQVCTYTFCIKWTPHWHEETMLLLSFPFHWFAGAYTGCFTRQHFLLLALQCMHNGVSRIGFSNFEPLTVHLFCFCLKGLPVRVFTPNRF